MVLPAVTNIAARSCPSVSAARATDRRRRIGPRRPAVVPAVGSVDVVGSLQDPRAIQPRIGDPARRRTTEARRAAVPRRLRRQRRSESRHAARTDHRDAYSAKPRPQHRCHRLSALRTSNTSTVLYTVPKYRTDPARSIG